MHCYVKDFGKQKLAVCEMDLPNGMHLTATERLQPEQTVTPSLWAQLGALLMKSGEVVEAQ